MLQFIHETTSLSQFTKQIPEGNYKGLLFEIDGTSDTGQTLTLANIGYFEILVNGAPKQYMTAAFCNQLNNLWKGYPRFAAAEAGATKVSLMIPFEIPERPNALTVKPDDNIVFRFTPVAGFDTAMASATIKVLGIMSGETEKYFPVILNADEAPAAAGTTKKMLPSKNVERIFISGTYIGNISVERDGDKVADGTHTSLVNLTALENRVEATGLTYAQIIVGDQVSDMINQSTSIQFYVSAADSVLINTLSIDIDPRRANESVAFVGSKVQKRLAPIRAARSAEVGVLLNNVSAD